MPGKKVPSPTGRPSRKNPSVERFDREGASGMTGGSRGSAYSGPKREPVRKERGNIGQVIREKQRRDWESGGGA